MAKKSRTPAPPRKIQAPQRRVEPRRQRTPEQRRTLWISGAFAASGIIAIVAVILFLNGRNDNNSSSSASTTPNTAQLIGVQTGSAPWNTGLDHLTDRLKPLGLSELGSEGTALHIHQHLDIFVNGKHISVPQGIGIFDGQYLTELHTHDASGVLHVESPTKRDFTLGDFFGVWGVRLTDKCIGGYCQPQTPWRVYVNGLNYPGNPAGIVLKKHQEIAMDIGTKHPKNVPATYNFGGL